MKCKAIVLSACALMLAGCGSPQPGWGVHTVSWDRSEANKTNVPGIDAASVRFGTYGKDAAVAFWTDANNGNCEAAFDKAADAVVYRAKYKGAGGRNIEADCSTKDGKSGVMHIDGQTFKLENGSLLLISTVGDKTTVKQLKRNLAELPRDVEPLRAISDAEREIHAFFEEQLHATATP